MLQTKQIKYSFTSQSGDYSLSTNSCLVIYTGTGNNTFTMPSVSSNLVVGREIIIKNLGSGILKVAPNASDLIDNTSGIITLYPGEALTMVSISTTWVMI